MNFYLVTASTFWDGGQTGHWDCLARCLVSGASEVDAIVEFVGRTGYEQTAGGQVEVLKLTDSQAAALNGLPMAAHSPKRAA